MVVNSAEIVLTPGPPPAGLCGAGLAGPGGQVGRGEGWASRLGTPRRKPATYQADSAGIEGATTSGAGPYLGPQRLGSQNAVLRQSDCPMQAKFQSTRTARPPRPRRDCHYARRCGAAHPTAQRRSGGRGQQYGAGPRFSQAGVHTPSRRNSAGWPPAPGAIHRSTARRPEHREPGRRWGQGDSTQRGQHRVDLDGCPWGRPGGVGNSLKNKRRRRSIAPAEQPRHERRASGPHTSGALGAARSTSLVYGLLDEGGAPVAEQRDRPRVVRVPTPNARQAVDRTDQLLEHCSHLPSMAVAPGALRGIRAPARRCVVSLGGPRMPVPSTRPVFGRTLGGACVPLGAVRTSPLPRQVMW